MFLKRSKQYISLIPIAAGFLATCNSIFTMQYAQDDKEVFKELSKSIQTLNDQFVEKINYTLAISEHIPYLDNLIEDIKDNIKDALLNVKTGAKVKDDIAKMSSVQQISSKLFNCIDTLNSALPGYDETLSIYAKTDLERTDFAKINAVHLEAIKETIKKLSKIESDLQYIEGSMLKKYKMPELVAASAAQLKQLAHTIKVAAEKILKDRKDRTPKKPGVLKRIFGK